MIVVLTAVNIFIGLEYNIFQTIYALIAAALLMGVLIRDVRSQFLTFFGKISYSHYLYHALIGYMVIDWIAGETLLSKILALTCASGVTVAVAALSFYLVEKPGIALGYRIESWLGKVQKSLYTPA